MRFTFSCIRCKRSAFGEAATATSDDEDEDEDEDDEDEEDEEEEEEEEEEELPVGPPRGLLARFFLAFNCLGMSLSFRSRILNKRSARSVNVPPHLTPRLINSFFNFS